MSFKELLKLMIRDFFVITAGIVISVAIFCSAFYPEELFPVEFFWNIISLGIMSSLPHFIFYSEKELNKRQMLTRQVIHFSIILLILFTVGYSWGWIATGNILQPVVFFLLVTAVYLGVKVLAFQNDRKMADLLNRKLGEFHNLSGQSMDKERKE
ncbi:DUF3021 domain-containing protein [Sinanaerobacter chloroacetimidivorans]|uniref:DUF3021 domain-containing protein n=1 Tax=Sinanaerobacter chloroacetimidivorans TaxID=2818044 RepID=A0A8J7W4I3_9FIRM|nr:DUF3021 domain-containing protein [Sinanaerobacter chloroacetimidivorans]MBR0600364.1 DUF3021 domain-containing protein [Sinanaerobacter chloroacetimidivorans]